MNATTQSSQLEGDFNRNVQQVEREDALIDHRVTWLLVFQGLLFTTMGLLLGRESDLAQAPHWLPMLKTVLPYVISLLGVVVSASVTWTVYIALYYQRELMEAWIAKYPHVRPTPFGRIRDPKSKVPVFFGPSTVISFFSALAWLALLGVLIVDALKPGCLWHACNC